MRTRRATLALLAGGATTALAGCTGVAGDLLDGGVTPVGGDGGLSYAFAGDLPARHQAPVIGRDDERLVLEGSVVTGSSTCSAVGLAGVEVTEHDGAAAIVIDLYARRVDTDGPCTDDISSTGYRVSIEPPAGAPDTVVVREEAWDGTVTETLLSVEDDAVELGGEVSIASSSFEDHPSMREPHTPQIAVEGSTIELTGTFLTGSSTCSTVGLASLEAVDDTLQVRLFARDLTEDADEPVPCTEDISPSGFVLRVAFAGALPDVVELITVDYAGTEARWELTPPATLPAAR